MKEKNRKKTFLRALANYSALGGALIGSLNQAEATIQYTTLSGTPVSNGTVMVPLPVGSLSFVEATGINSALLYLRNGTSVSGGTWYPYPLSSGQNVNGGGAWQTATTQFLAWGGTMGSGYWLGETGKFIAFSFNDGGTKYGWIRLSVSADAGSFTLIDMAYQDDGSSILTGQTAPLPMELLSFDAERLQDQVQLLWSTAQEENFDGFSLERAEEGVGFSEIAWISGAGNSKQEQQYAFRDQTALTNKHYYYRLKSVDVNGSFAYSQIIEVAFSDPGFTIGEPYPNPITSGQFSIDLFAREPEDVGLNLFTSTGQMVFEANYLLSVGVNPLKIALPPLPSGTYFLKIQGKFYNGYKQVMVK